LSESLTAADLSRFEDELRKQDVPALKYLRAGLAAPDAEQSAAAVGLRLPQEALTWFGWHDGVEPAERPSEHMLGRFELLGLADAIDGYRWRREQALEDEPEFEEEVWSRRWLPFAVRVTSRTLALDISGPLDAPVPVYLIDAQDPEEANAPKCASMKAMVELWTDALAQGLWRWDHAKRKWEIADRSAMSGDSADVVFG
jgi:hypothetical protein